MLLIHIGGVGASLVREPLVFQMRKGFLTNKVKIIIFVQHSNFKGWLLETPGALGRMRQTGRGVTVGLATLRQRRLGAAL